MRYTLVLLMATVVLAGADTAGGIKWNPPAGWKAQGQRPMRAATYTVPAAPGDKEPGECAVYYFGPNEGGGVDANIKRWIGQFEQPDGSPSAKKAQIHKQTANGLSVTTIDVSGTYTGAGGPMAPTRISKPGYRLLGAIVGGPQGAVFFKFTGPARTVAGAQTAFQGMLKSLSR